MAITDIRSTVLRLPERGPAGPPGASGDDYSVDTAAAADGMDLPGSVHFFRTGGATAVGDGGADLYVEFPSDPGTGSALQVADGRWFDIPPRSQYEEVIDLEWFMRKYGNNPDPVYPLQKAHEELFNQASAVPLVLECQGVELKFDRPCLLRRVGASGSVRAVLNFGANPRRDDKIIRNLSITRITGTYAWQPRDYLYSIAGEAGFSDLRDFALLNPRIDVADGGQVGIHVSGYYIIRLISPNIRGLAHADAIGILSTKYALDTGIGNPGGLTDNANHGLRIIQPNIRGSFATHLGVGVYLEDGDCDIEGGDIAWLEKGVWTKRGGLNTHAVHFSQADGTDSKIAIQCDVPRVCFLADDELDGSYIYFDNPTDNMYSEGASYTDWFDLTIRGQKFSGSTIPPSGRGLIHFNTQSAANTISGLIVRPDQDRVTGHGDGAVDLVKFTASGAGAWNGAGFGKVLFAMPSEFGLSPGSFPTGVRIGIMRSAGGEVHYDPETARTIFKLAGSNDNDPYIEPGSGNSLVFGRLASGTPTPYWQITNSGSWRPVTTNLYDIGANAAQVKDAYLNGSLIFGTGATGINADSGTATAVAGAATLNKMAGKITSEALVTAALAAYTLTLTNSLIAAADTVHVTLAPGTSTTGIPVVTRVTPAAGSVTIRVHNLHATEVFNGTQVIGFLLVKA